MDAARAIMGPEAADKDPLAWWCATELIFNIGKGSKNEKA